MNNKILLFCLGLFLSCSSFGQGFQFDPGKVFEQRINSTALAAKPGNYPDTLALTNDDHWSDLTSNYSSFMSNHAYKSVQDFVEVGIKHDSLVEGAYDYEITFSLLCYKVNNGGTDLKTGIKLRVSYDPDSLKPYEDQQNFQFNGYFAFRAIVTNIQDLRTNPTSQATKSAIGRNFYIRTAVVTQRYDKDDLYVHPTCSASNNILHVSWGTNTVNSLGCQVLNTNDIKPVEFELEWQYIDDYSFDLGNGTYSNRFCSTCDINYDFRKNSTRIRTKDNFFDIPLVYERGAIVYRVRAIRPDPNPPYQTVVYRPWSTVADAGTVNANEPCRAYVIASSHTNDSLNWQYTINFAEEGKYKHVINYFDGSLRNRQTQTKINTDNNYIIAVDKSYDYEGRPVIQTLPSPLIQTYLGYRRDVAINAKTSAPYVPADYDHINCSLPDSLPPMSSAAKANEYYSPGNPDQSGMQKYVADAKGYPFVQSQLMPDGRLLWQGGAGLEHQLWRGHATRHDYVTATQDEVKSVLGNATTGDANFFTKEVITDPNGQSSFVLRNKDKQTIASGLIGDVDSGTPIDRLSNFPSNQADLSDILAGDNQYKTRNGSSITRDFYSEVVGQSTLEYRVGIPAYAPAYTRTGNPNCGSAKYLWVGAKYNYDITNDCGQLKLTQSGSVGKDSVLNSNVRAYYKTSAVPADLDKAKYTIHKELSFSRSDIENLVRPFIKSREPYCYFDAQYFMRKSVEKASFPCVDSGYIDPCELRRRQMISEMWPGAKYGKYIKNDDSSVKTQGWFTGLTDASGIPAAPWCDSFHVVGSNPDSISIFDPIIVSRRACGYAIQPPLVSDTTFIYRFKARYQMDCINLPSSVTKDGRTYTNLRTMSPDSFIYVFNNDIATALLPLHPEYCKLALCDDGSFTKDLESTETKEQAYKADLFSLDRIIKQDPLYKNASPSDSAIMAFRLKHFKNFNDKRLDQMAIEQAYCSAGNGEEVQHCRKFLYPTQIAGFIFVDSAVKQQYFAILKGYYLANRTYLLQRLMDSTGSTCGPCNSIRIKKVVGSPVFPPVFASNGTGLDTSMHLPDWMEDMFDHANDPNYVWSNTIPQPIKDSIAAQQASLCEAQVDGIMNQLQNCQATSGELASIRANLLAYCNSGGLESIRPDSIKKAIMDAGVSLNDLCHPFLASLGSYSGSVPNTTYDCAKPNVYTGVSNLLSRTEMLTVIKNAVLGGSASQQFYLDPNNAYENKIAQSLAIASNAQVTVTGYLDTIRFDASNSLKFVKVTIAGGAGSMNIYFRQKETATSFLDGASSLTVNTVTCLNNDKGAAIDGYIAKNTCVADIAVNGALPGKYYVWSDKISLMLVPNAGDLNNSCITCIDIKNALKDFKADKAAYSYDDASNHPLFESTLANYLNNKLGKQYSFNDYYALMNGCAVTDSVRLKRHMSTIRVSFTAATNAAADNNAASFIAGLTGFGDGKDLVDHRIKYQSGGNTVVEVYIDLSPVSKDSIRKFKDRIMGSLAPDNSGTAAYLPDDDLLVFIQEGSGCTANLTSLGFSNSADSIYLGNRYYGYKQYRYTGSYASEWYRAGLNATIKGILTTCPGSIALFDGELLRSADYATTPKQSFLAYMASLEGLPHSDVVDSINANNIKNRIGAFSGKTISYQDAFCTQQKTDLYAFAPVQPGNGGFSRLESIIGTIKPLVSYKLFPATNYSGTNVAVYKKANGVYWYRYFGTNDTLYNLYIEPPAHLNATQKADLVMDYVRVAQGQDSSRRFTAYMHYGSATSDTVACRGYADFTVGYSQKVQNVVLQQAAGGLDYCLDSNDCERWALQSAREQGMAQYLMHFDSLSSAMTDDMLAYVVNNAKDSLILNTNGKKFQITKFRYDLAGNLDEVIRPSGAQGGRYEYDTRNAIIKQTTRSGGTTRMYYDGAGRLVFSQNDKQLAGGLFSYTLYDDQSRIIETGEVMLGSNPNYVLNLRDDNTYSHENVKSYVRTKNRNDVVITTYDSARVDLGAIAGEHLSTPENLVGRVSSISYYLLKNADPGPWQPADTTEAQYATYYSYDMMGNVKTISYSVLGLKQLKQRYKRVDYDYDQISGKVNMLSYNRGKADQFYHRYEYDADNRITKAETSKDGVIWNRDAEYSYYKHGPLAEVKIGEHQLQGLQYAYTIQGWLKAMNSDATLPARDMGQDGNDPTYARDVIAHSIDYFKDDYTPIGSGLHPADNYSAPTENLYNGNIARQVTAFALPGTGNNFNNRHAFRTTYRYDQVQRLTEAKNEVLDQSNFTTNPIATLFNSSYEYDADGNIQRLKRNDGTGSGSTIDDILYTYQSGSDRLSEAYDQGYSSSTVDFPRMPSGANYFYDATGNLAYDKFDSSKMTWNVYGKLRSVVDSPAASPHIIYYDYDGLGNRVRKEVVTKIDSKNESHVGEYYVRDATGNILAVYKYDSRLGPISLIQAANNEGFPDKVANPGPFVGFVKTTVGTQASFPTVFTDYALTEATAWTDGQIAKPIGLYLDHIGDLYDRVLINNPVNYLNDLQSYDNTNGKTLISGTLECNPEGLQQLWTEIFNCDVVAPDPPSGSGAEAKKMLTTFCGYVPWNFYQDTWNYISTPGEPAYGSCGTNTEELYSYALANSKLNDLATKIKQLVVDDLNMSSTGSWAYSFLNDIVFDGSIYAFGQPLYELFNPYGNDPNNFLTAVASLPDETVGNMFETLLNFDPPVTNPVTGGAEAQKLLVHVQNEMAPTDFATIWTNVGAPGSPASGDEAGNAYNLYSYAVVNGMIGELGYELKNLVVSDVTTNGSAYAHGFFNTVFFDDDIYKSPHLRTGSLPNSGFENELTMQLLGCGPRTGLKSFFNQWEHATDWMNSEMTKTERLTVVYQDNPDATITDFFTTQPDSAIATVIAKMPDVTALDYSEKVIKTMPTDAGNPGNVINWYYTGNVRDSIWLAEHHLYGSSRLGIQQCTNALYSKFDIDPGVAQPKPLNASVPWYSYAYADLVKKDQKSPWGQGHTDTTRMNRTVGYRSYELTDHTGNVLATILDRKTGFVDPYNGFRYSFFYADVAAAQDYYPGGFVMEQRSSLMNDTSYKYRYGAQGQQKENNLQGATKDYSYINNALFWQMDNRLMQRWNVDPRPNLSMSPYVAYNNNPILYTDVLGDSVRTTFYDKQGKQTNQIPAIVQKKYNEEYGISLGYNAETKMLYKTGTVSTNQKVSATALKMWNKELGAGHSQKSLEFGYNYSFMENGEEQAVLYGVYMPNNTAYIDLADFTENGNAAGIDFSGSNTKVSTRAFNLARVNEHEFLGHGISGLTDGGGGAGHNDDAIGNVIRLEMGLPTRLNYLMKNQKMEIPIENQINREVPTFNFSNGGSIYLTNPAPNLIKTKRIN